MLALENEFDENISVFYTAVYIATSKGVAVIEFNARFGDPEVMNVLSVLESNFADLCQDMLNGRLNPTAVRFAPLATVANTWCRKVIRKTR